ncbi:protein phosphatase [Crossiella equi]|uniref:Protein phosphatase n=1 Tax=Crossiella equi TaxID=130796 RepID=A0ABS5AQL7_9PSEU|nr:hypothetical protein [Crossiella equi]MBP2478692.1 protein phosphatase [Crossiella equi]
MSEPDPPRAVCQGAATHPGSRRHNADSSAHDTDPETGMSCWAVADGIGDRLDAGEAAHTAATTSARCGVVDGAGAGLLAAADALADPDVEWPRANCVLVVAAQRSGGRIDIAWAGDARCYRYAAGELTLLTRDHTAGEWMRRSGDPDRVARAHRYDHIVTTTVATARRDGHDRVSTDDDFDALLLCSDGIGKVLPDEDIVALLDEHAADPQHCAEHLVAAAVAEAGPDADNATALVVFPER